MALIVAVCSGAWAQRIGVDNNIANGTVAVDNANPTGAATVTLTVTPATGYYITASDIVVTRTALEAQAPRRAPGLGTTYAVTAATVDATGKGTYTFSVEDGYGAYVEATFTACSAITPSVSIDGWTYGEAANSPSVTGNPGNGGVTYYYKVKDADDNTYTTTKPSTVGNYTVRATIAAAGHYLGGSATKDFSIAALTGVVVTITGHNNKAAFNGTEHTVSGYDVSISNNLYKETDFSFSGTAEAKRTEVGKTMMGLQASQFTNGNANFTGVTFNVTDGYQEITSIDEVIVTITGHINTTDYDGKEHTVSGYDVSISNALYKESDFTFSGTAQAKRTDAGKTMMGLDVSQFANTNNNFGNVTFNVTDGYQEISPIAATVTITGHHDAVTYDGKEHSVTGYDATFSNSLYKETDFTFSGTASAARTEVGKTMMGLDASQFTNNNANFTGVTFNVTDGYLQITAVTDVVVTITGHSNKAAFDGTEHSVSGYDVSISNNLYKESDFTFSGTASAVRTVVGKTMMGLTASQFTNNNANFSNVTFNVTDGFQEITSIDEVIVTITGHINTTDYDGKEHTVSGYDVSISNALYKESDFTFSGTAEAKRTDAGKTMMGLDVSQFANTNNNFGNVTFNVTDGYQEISPIAATVTITGHHDAVTYDGKEHSVTGYDATFSNSLYKETDFTFSGTASAARTEVGKTMMGLDASQFTNNNANFTGVTFNVTDGYLQITAVTDVVVTITGHNNTTDYDGTAHSVSGYDVKISNPLYKETDFTFNGTAEAKRTNAGKTMMGLAASQFANTNPDFTSVTFNVTDGYQEISPITATVTIKGHSDIVVYDGTEHQVSGYDATFSNSLYKETDFTFSGTAEAKRTDAGKTTMGLAASQFTNTNTNFSTVTFNVIDGYQTINKKVPVLTVTVTPKAYDGNTDAEVTVTVDTHVNGESLTITGLTGTFDDASAGEDKTVTLNSSKAVVTPGANTKLDNYEVVYPTQAKGTITGLTAVVVTITGHSNKAAFDGTEHSVSGYDVSISNPLYKESDFTFSGTASAVRTVVGKTMMGLTASQFTNNNANFSNVTFNVTDGFQEITSIDEVIVTITGHINTTDYDGKEHTVSGYDVSISNALYKESDFTFSGTAEAKRTDAGKTMMGLDVSQFANTNNNFGNVTFNVTDGYQEISPIAATVTITGHHDAVTYDGKEHSVTGYDATFSNSLYKETDFTFSGTASAARTEVGKTMMGLDASQFTNNNANFTGVTFNVTDGYLQITAVTDVVVTITGHNNTTDYDGTAHSVSGYDVKISNPLYKESDFTFNGTAEAKRTDAGKTTMGLAASQFANTNPDFTSVTFNVTDGYQEISPITATVTIKGHSDIVVYDGTEHQVSGYDATFSNSLYKETDFTFSGTAEAKRTDAGKTTMGLAASQFTNTNTNFSTVTFNVIDGYQTINKKVPVLTVTVTPKAYDGNTDAEVTVTVDTHVNGESLTITGLTGTFDDASAGEDKTVTLNSSKAVVTPDANTKLDNYEVVYPTQVKGTIFDRRHSGIMVRRNDTNELVDNNAFLTVMADGTLRIDQISIVNPDVVNGIAAGVSIDIPATLKDYDGTTGAIYGVASDIIVTDANVPVTDINMPETDKMINVATHAFHLNTTAGTTARIHTSLALLDDYALTPGLKAEYEDGHVMTTVHVTSDYWTLSSGVDVALPKAVTPLICKLYDNSSLATYPITEPVIKTDEGEQVLLWSNNGVLLKSLPGDYTLTAWPTATHPSGSAISTEPANSYEGNLLECIVESRHLPYNEGYYVLKDGKFHPIKDNDAKIPAGKAVVHLPKNSPAILAPVLTIYEGTTGIALIDNGQLTIDNDAWYSLDGRKLDKKPTSKGIYIYGGKKRVIR